jgi:hypothetical protein
MRIHLLLASSVFVLGSYLAVGCASPPAPIPTGAWSVQFVHGDATCVINNHNTVVGMIDVSGATAVVTDGVKGAEVICSVKKNGNGFDIDGHVLNGGSNLSIQVNGLTPGATMMAPVQGVASYISSSTQNVFTSPTTNPCNFYIVPDKEGVTPGNVFVSFDCPDVENGMQHCAINAGVIKMANCDGAVVM